MAIKSLFFGQVQYFAIVINKLITKPIGIK